MTLMESYLYESCSLASHLTYCFLGYCIRLHLCLQFLCKLFTLLSEDIRLSLLPPFCWQRDPSLLLAAFGDPVLWLRSPTREPARALCLLLPAPPLTPSCIHVGHSPHSSRSQLMVLWLRLSLQPALPSRTQSWCPPPTT